MKQRAYRTTIFTVAFALAHTVTLSNVALAEPQSGTSIKAVQNSAGTTAFVIVTSKKYAKDTIAVT
jgi:hypothetical protein